MNVKSLLLAILVVVAAFPLMPAWAVPVSISSSGGIISFTLPQPVAYELILPVSSPIIFAFDISFPSGGTPVASSSITYAVGSGSPQTFATIGAFFTATGLSPTSSVSGNVGDILTVSSGTIMTGPLAVPDFSLSADVGTILIIPSGGFEFQAASNPGVALTPSVPDEGDTAILVGIVLLLFGCLPGVHRRRFCQVRAMQ